MVRGTSLRRSTGGNGNENLGSQQTNAFDMSQHAWLLAPLRELSDNWEVDLAGDLNEYLDTLADLEFTFDGGDTKLNFAEAALLIQGSACVYSKKVEYLHSLVYHALDVITSHKKKKTTITTTRGAQSALEDEDFFLEDEDHFLNLDDILEEANDIDLDELRAKQFTPSRRVVANTSALHLSAGKNGGGLGDSKLMMSSSFVHHSGALLLERRDLVHLDAELMPNVANAAAAINDAGLVNGDDDDDMNMMMDDAGAGFAGFDGDDDDGGEHDALDNENGVSNPTDNPMMMGEDGDPIDFVRGDAGTAGADGAEEDVPCVADDENGDEDAFDPYAALDPYDASGMAAKPFRKASTRQTRRKKGGGEAAGILLSSGVIPNANVSSGPCFAEFGYAFLEAERAQRRIAQRSGSADARLRHQQSSVYAGGDIDPVDQELEDAGLAADDIFGGDAPDLGDDDFELPNETLDFEMPAPMEDLDVGDPEVSYEALCRQHIDRIIAAAAAEEVRSELAQRVSIWQGKIEPVLKEADTRPAFDIRVYKKDIIESYVYILHACATAPHLSICAAGLVCIASTVVVPHRSVYVGLTRVQTSVCSVSPLCRYIHIYIYIYIYMCVCVCVCMYTSCLSPSLMCGTPELRRPCTLAKTRSRPTMVVRL